jgi:hypothetical protein
MESRKGANENSSATFFIRIYKLQSKSCQAKVAKQLAECGEAAFLLQGNCAPSIMRRVGKEKYNV